MPRSLYAPFQNPYGSFRNSFYEEGDDPDNPLKRFRDIYKNLTPTGGWHTQALQGYSQKLKRRLGESEQEYRGREAEYQRRIREGEDARSLLGSQLNDSRSELDGFRKKYQEEQGLWGEERSRYASSLQDFERRLQEEQSQHLFDMQSQSERFSEAFDKSLNPFAQFVRERNPGRYNEIMSEQGDRPFSQSSIYSRNAPSSFYQTIESDWDIQEQQRKRLEEQTRQKEGALLSETQKRQLMEGNFKKFKDQYDQEVSQDPLAKGYDPNYQVPDMQAYRKQFMEQNVWPVARQLMERNALKNPALKNHPWLRGFPNYLSNEGLDPATLTDDQVRIKQQYVNERAPTYGIQPSPSYNAPNPKMTLPDYRRWKMAQREARQEQTVQGYDQKVKQLTGDGTLWQARYNALLPKMKEYENYRRDVSPLRREHPELKAFREKYKHVDLNAYHQIPAMKQSYEQGAQYVNQFKNNYNELLKRKKAVDTFIHYYPEAGPGLHKELGYKEGAQTMNPWPWASK